MKIRAIKLLKDKPTLIVTYLNGFEVEKITELNCFAVGKALAKMHQVTKSLPENRRNTRGLSWIEDTYLDMKSKLTSTEKEYN